jgi:hypothetical protein
MVEDRSIRLERGIRGLLEDYRDRDAPAEETLFQISELLRDATGKGVILRMEYDEDNLPLEGGS